jgi:hypothetical protein
VEKACPVCDAPAVGALSPHGGRRPIYCSLACRRLAEKRVLRYRRSIAWAKQWTSLSPAHSAALQAIYGKERFAARVQIAKDLLAAEQSLQAREAGQQQTVENGIFT